MWRQACRLFSINRTRNLLSGILLLIPLGAWASINWWEALREVHRFYIDLPVWDYFSLMEHYQAYKAWDLTVFWIQHNEHRIVFPEIVCAIDLVLFHGHMVLPTALSLVFFFGTWALMSQAFWRDGGVTVVPRCGAILLAAIVIAWKGCALALAMPFLLQWTLGQFFAVATFACLSEFYVNRRLPWLTTSALCCIVGTYSGGAGLPLWPMVVVLAICLRLPWRQILALTLAAGLTIGLYFMKYRSLGALDWWVLLQHPWYFLEFLAAYVSMPFAMLRPETEFGVRVGLASLAVLGAAFFGALQLNILKSRTAIVSFGYCAFALASGVMTALGRMNPNDPLLQSAKAPRYLTVPMVYWCAVAILSVWIVFHAAKYFRQAATLTLVICLSILLFRMAHKPNLARWYDAVVTTSFADQQWAALAVESGIMDRATNGILFSGPDFVVQYEKLMREERLFFWADPEPFWVGRKLSSVFQVLPGKLEGGVSAIEPLTNAVALAGWSLPASTDSNPLEFVIVDELNRIVGLGKSLPAGLPSRFSRLGIAQKHQWFGFVKQSILKGVGITAFAVSQDKKTVTKLNTTFSPKSAPSQ